MDAIYHLAGQVAVTSSVQDPRVDFEIKNLATGYIAASESAKGGVEAFELEGKLNFDTKMFEKANIGVTYKDGKWGGQGGHEQAAVAEQRLHGRIDG